RGDFRHEPRGELRSGIRATYPDTRPVFEMSREAESAQIWRVQLHPARTPPAPAVDFQAVARPSGVSGADIRNAVLKAPLPAAAESGPDSAKRIHQHHFE